MTYPNSIESSRKIKEWESSYNSNREYKVNINVNVNTAPTPTDSRPLPDRMSKVGCRETKLKIAQDNFDIFVLMNFIIICLNGFE